MSFGHFVYYSIIFIFLILLLVLSLFDENCNFIKAIINITVALGLVIADYSYYKLGCNSIPIARFNFITLEFVVNLIMNIMSLYSIIGFVDFLSHLYFS